LPCGLVIGSDAAALALSSSRTHRSPVSAVSIWMSCVRLMSGRRLASVPTSVASDSKMTHVPPAESTGAPLRPLPGAPRASREASSRVPVVTSWRTTCGWPFDANSGSVVV
jgi:hypothetical protein